MTKELQKGVDYIGVVVAFYIHDGNGKIFFTQRSEKCRNNHHKWECGGGGMKFGELPEETLARELKEELLCEDFTINEQLPSISCVHETERGKEHWLSVPYIICVDPADIGIGEPEMIEDSGWFAWDDMPEDIDYGTRHELEIYKETFQKYIK